MDTMTQIHTWDSIMGLIFFQWSHRKQSGVVELRGSWQSHWLSAD